MAPEFTSQKIEGKLVRQGYNYVKDYIINVHVKDALIEGKTNLKKYVVLGKGNMIGIPR